MGKNRGKQAAAGSTIASRQSKTAGTQNKVIYQQRLNKENIFLGVDERDSLNTRSVVWCDIDRGLLKVPFLLT